MPAPTSTAGHPKVVSLPALSIRCYPFRPCRRLRFSTRVQRSTRRKHCCGGCYPHNSDHHLPPGDIFPLTAMCPRTRAEARALLLMRQREYLAAYPPKRSTYENPVTTRVAVVIAFLHLDFVRSSPLMCGPFLVLLETFF